MLFIPRVTDWSPEVTQHSDGERGGSHVNPAWVHLLIVRQRPARPCITVCLSPPFCSPVINQEGEVVGIELKFPSHLQKDKANGRNRSSYLDIALLLVCLRPSDRRVIIQTWEVRDIPSAHTVQSRAPSLFMSHRQHLTTASLWSDTLMQSEVSAEQPAQR